MAKTKTPFLSLGSSGTVGGVLTAQKRGRATLLRSTPKPTDPYSLAQAYQRWDYRDYAYRWTLQSEASKQSYRTRASRYHITGFSLWMREHLKDLPDLAGRWHLDEKLGATAYDSSKNANNGIIVGATPSDGRIAGGLYFDGLNDFVSIPYKPILNLTSLSIDFFLFPIPTAAIQQWILSRPWSGTIRSYFLRLEKATRTLTFGLYAGAWRSVTSTLTFNWSTFNHIAVTFEKPNVYFYINGIQDTVKNLNFDLPPSTMPLIVGYYVAANALWLKGHLDHLSLENRVLNPTEVTRHSVRRYPA